VDALAQAAPRVTLQCVPVADASLRDDMASGRVDLALGLLPQLQAGPDGARKLQALSQAALADDSGKALDQMLATV